MYILIINPIAGNGRAKRFYENLIKQKVLQHISFQTFYTAYKGHAEEITEMLLKKYRQTDIKAIIVFGGDGTLHEVLNGTHQLQIPISFIPGGSGNDFARGISLEKNQNKLIHNIFLNHQKTTYSL